MNRTASRLSLFLLAFALVAAGCASTGDAPSSGSKASTPANAAAAGPGPAAAPAAKDAGKSPVPATASETNKTAPAKTAPPPSRIGDVKISLFTLGKGKFSTKEAVGTYLMVVNPSWVRHKRPYTEPFFPIAKPGLKIVEDEIMEGLLKHLADSGFWNMPEANKIDVAALRRPNVDNVRYVTVTRDGVTRIVERRLGSGLLDKFIDMEYGINQVWHASSTYVTETQRQNWLDAFQTHYELKKAQDRAAEQGTAPAAGSDPGAGSGTPTEKPKDGSGATPGGSTGK